LWKRKSSVPTSSIYKQGPNSLINDLKNLALHEAGYLEKQPVITKESQKDRFNSSKGMDASSGKAMSRGGNQYEEEQLLQAQKQLSKFGVVADVEKLPQGYKSFETALI